MAPPLKQDPFALTPAVVGAGKAAWPYIKKAVPWLGAFEGSAPEPPEDLAAAAARAAEQRAQPLGPPPMGPQFPSTYAGPKFQTLPGGGIAQGTPDKRPMPLQGGSEWLERSQYNPHNVPGSYNFSGGKVDPESLTATSMASDAALRGSFAERELEPLREAAARSSLEMQAADPLAKERLLGGFEVASRRAPFEAQRQFDLEDQKILEALGPKIEAEFMANPKWVAMKKTNPEQADALLKEQLRRKVQEFKDARGKFTERMGMY